MGPGDGWGMTGGRQGTNAEYPNPEIGPGRGGQGEAATSGARARGVDGGGRQAVRVGGCSA